MTQRYSFLMLKRAITRGDGQQTWYAGANVVIESQAGPLGIRISDEFGIVDIPAEDVAWSTPILMSPVSESAKPFSRATEILKGEKDASKRK